MIPQPRKHFVVTVHHGDPKPTHRLIDSLLSSEQKPDGIIVVDHAQEVFVRQTDHKLIHLVRPTANTGYAGGINVGLGFLASRNPSPHDIIVAVNNDVQFSPDSLQNIRRWWDNHPQAAVIAGAKLGHVNLFTGRSRLIKRSSSWYALPYLHGSILTVPVALMLKLQGLPTQYFLYWEDVLFSRRARLLNAELTVIPNLNIRHNDSLRQVYTDNQMYYLVRNGALFLSRHSPVPWKLYWWAANLLRLAYHIIFATRPIIRHALVDALRGKTGPRSPAP